MVALLLQGAAPAAARKPTTADLFPHGDVVWHQRDSSDPLDPKVSYAQTQSRRGELVTFCEYTYQRSSPVRRWRDVHVGPATYGIVDVAVGRPDDYPLCASSRLWTSAAVTFRDGVFLTAPHDGTGRVSAQRFGRAGDRPLVGTWNGAYEDTVGVYRDGVFYLSTSAAEEPQATADIVVRMGRPGDFAVVGDWDGDGRDSPGVVRGNLWFLDDDFDGRADRTIRFGRPTDYPLVGRTGYTGFTVDAPVALRCSPRLGDVPGCDLRTTLDPLRRR